MPDAENEARPTDSAEIRSTTFVVDGIPMSFDEMKAYRAGKVEKTAEAAKVTIFGTDPSNGLAYGVIEGGEGVDGNLENANWMRQNIEPPDDDEDIDD